MVYKEQAIRDNIKILYFASVSLMAEVETLPGALRGRRRRRLCLLILPLQLGSLVGLRGEGRTPPSSPRATNWSRPAFHPFPFPLLSPPTHRLTDFSKMPL